MSFGVLASLILVLNCRVPADFGAADFTGGAMTVCSAGRMALPGGFAARFSAGAPLVLVLVFPIIKCLERPGIFTTGLRTAAS